MKAVAILADGSSTLTAVLAAAVTTTNPAYSVISEIQGIAREENGFLNGVTAVTIAAQPSQGGDPKTITSVEIYNADTAACTVTVSKKVGSNSYGKSHLTLQPGDTLRMDTQGVYLITNS